MYVDLSNDTVSVESSGREGSISLIFFLTALATSIVFAVDC